jgi:uncharacterized membrane protein YdfJ with MMPL/SSD domain
MMLFAIVFGLSMDYEVFLLSAIRSATTPPATTTPPWWRAWRRRRG